MSDAAPEQIARELVMKVKELLYSSSLTKQDWQMIRAIEAELKARDERAPKLVAQKVAILRKEKLNVQSGNKYDLAFIEGGLGVMEKLLEDLIEQDGDTVGDLRDRAEAMIAAIRNEDTNAK